uniref:Predicted transcriptional regulator n=1 Tax=Rhizobium fredii TaxID=380 RepID=D1CSX8_RHIFR|nr:predicted transcriptional regulator [Sinorhizobium fredii]
MIGNARVVGYLTQTLPDILAEFQKITEARKVA